MYARGQVPAFVKRYSTIVMGLSFVMVFCGSIMYTQPWIIGYNQPYGTHTRGVLEFTPTRFCFTNSTDILTSCWRWEELKGNDTCCGFQAKFGTIGKLAALSLFSSAAAGTVAVFRIACFGARLLWTLVGIAALLAAAGSGGLAAFLLYNSTVVDSSLWAAEGWSYVKPGPLYRQHGVSMIFALFQALLGFAGVACFAATLYGHQPKPATVYAVDGGVMGLTSDGRVPPHVGIRRRTHGERKHEARD